jgi:CheY-like chemotaxis protein
MAHILIAEDERDIRELVMFTLMFAGHEVSQAANGAEAVEMAGKVNPDLILMDVRMPRMTGYEACSTIKADPALAGIPVVFLSAKGQDEEIETGRSVGADDYILKPFAPDALVRRIDQILAANASRAAETEEAPAVAEAPAVPEPTPRAEAPAVPEPLAIAVTAPVPDEPSPVADPPPASDAPAAGEAAPGQPASGDERTAGDSLPAPDTAVTPAAEEAAPDQLASDDERAAGGTIPAPDTAATPAAEEATTPEAGRAAEHDEDEDPTHR